MPQELRGEAGPMESTSEKSGIRPVRPAICPPCVQHESDHHQRSGGNRSPEQCCWKNKLPPLLSDFGSHFGRIPNYPALPTGGEAARGPGSSGHGVWQAHAARTVSLSGGTGEVNDAGTSKKKRHRRVGRLDTETLVGTSAVPQSSMNGETWGVQ